MLPKWHILFGAIFSIIMYYFFSLTYFETSLIFLASIFIDVDHYVWYVNKKKDFSLKKAYILLKEFKKPKTIMMLFHTFEFLLIVFLLCFLWRGFLFILIGMLFHSFLDIIDMGYNDELEFREFFLSSYLLSDKNDYY